jgi:Fic family protein
MDDELSRELLSGLLDEKEIHLHGGLYHKTQIELAYNSNCIEGSKLTEDQTRYIFETKTIGFSDEDAVPVDDIIETVNHFTAFDDLLNSIDEELSQKVIKRFHTILKSNTSDSRKSWFNVGDYKQRPNEVAGEITTLPNKVEAEMEKLLEVYNQKTKIEFNDVIKFHKQFESIHPFQDGNGRVGRLIMFRECLRNRIIPFIIFDKSHKQYYYRGLKEFEFEPNFLIETCLSAQDTYREWVEYFYKKSVKEKNESDKYFNEHRHYSGNDFLKSELIYVDPKVSDKLSDKNMSIQLHASFIIQYAKQHKEIMSSEIAKLLNVNERTSRRLLREMSDNGLLELHGANRNRTYSLATE